MINYSTTADVGAVQELFRQLPDLEKLAFEFCVAFPHLRVNSVYNKRISLHDENGLQLGHLGVAPGSAITKDGKRVTRYEFSSDSVQKARYTNTDRQTRDSTNIKSLITVIKKNNEVPDAKKVLETFKRGIIYAFEATHKKTRLDFSLPMETQLALVKFHLQLDKLGLERYALEIKDTYEAYVKNTEERAEHDKTYNRFCAGSYLIGYLPQDGHYLVGEASCEGEKITIHEGVKRYTTLKDHPEHAGTVAMINAWASGQPNHNKNNEFGLPFNDKYYPDLDVSTGYRGQDALWMLIPKNPA